MRNQGVFLLLLATSVTAANPLPVIARNLIADVQRSSITDNTRVPIAAQDRSIYQYNNPSSDSFSSFSSSPGSSVGYYDLDKPTPDGILKAWYAESVKPQAKKLFEAQPVINQAYGKFITQENSHLLNINRNETERQRAIDLAARAVIAYNRDIIMSAHNFPAFRPSTAINLQPTETGAAYQSRVDSYISFFNDDAATTVPVSFARQTGVTTQHISTTTTMPEPSRLLLSMEMRSIASLWAIYFPGTASQAMSTTKAPEVSYSYSFRSVSTTFLTPLYEEDPLETITWYSATLIGSVTLKSSTPISVPPSPSSSSSSAFALPTEVPQAVYVVSVLVIIVSWSA